MIKATKRNLLILTIVMAIVAISGLIDLLTGGDITIWNIAVVVICAIGAITNHSNYRKMEK